MTSGLTSRPVSAAWVLFTGTRLAPRTGHAQGRRVQPTAVVRAAREPAPEVDKFTELGGLRVSKVSCPTSQPWGQAQGLDASRRVWKAESRRAKAARLDLEVSEGWASMSSRRLWVGDALLHSTGWG
jgi:hypothetical protein